MKNAKNESTTYTVTSNGGNKYLVTSSDGESRNIDLDGLCIVSKEDYEAMEDAGVDMEYYMTPEDHDVTGEADPHWKAAAEYSMQYNGFVVEDVLAEHEDENCF